MFGQQLAAAHSLGPALFGQPDVHPTGEQILGVPVAFAVAEQHQRAGVSHAGKSLTRRASLHFVDQVGERLQVLQRLAARHPPLPLLLDRGAKSQLQQRVKVRVHRLEHLSEHPVDLVGVDRRQRHPAHQIDVADVVQRVGDPVEPAVALEQEPVDALVVLVGLAAHERLDAHRVLADAQDGVRLELALPGQLDDEPGWPAVRALVFRKYVRPLACSASSITLLAPDCSRRMPLASLPYPRSGGAPPPPPTRAAPTPRPAVKSPIARR